MRKVVTNSCPSSGTASSSSLNLAESWLRKYQWTWKKVLSTWRNASTTCPLYGFKSRGMVSVELKMIERRDCAERKLNVYFSYIYIYVFLARIDDRCPFRSPTTATMTKATLDLFHHRGRNRSMSPTPNSSTEQSNSADERTVSWVSTRTFGHKFKQPSLLDAPTSLEIQIPYKHQGHFFQQEVTSTCCSRQPGFALHRCNCSTRWNLFNPRNPTDPTQCSRPCNRGRSSWDCKWCCFWNGNPYWENQNGCVDHQQCW